MNKLSLSRTAALGWVLTLTSGCSGSSAPAMPLVTAIEAAAATPASVDVVIDPTSIEVSSAAWAIAIVKDRKGNVIDGSNTSWSTSDVGIATVSSGGVVSGKVTGLVRITATVAGVSGSAPLTVQSQVTTAATALAVTVQPSASAQNGVVLAQQPSVQLRDAAGKIVAKSGVVVRVTANGGGTLLGTATASTNATGAATFSGLGITGSGTHTLIFSAPGLTSAQSGSIAVSHSTTTLPPLLLEDFSKYSSTSELVSNSTGHWRTNMASNTNRIVLDSVAGYGSSTKSMRYDWPNNGLVCTDYQIKPGFLTLPKGLTHVWVEYVVRFSPNFTTHAPGAPSCGDAYKLGAMYSLTSSSVDGSRWDFSMHSNKWETNYPGGTGSTSHISSAVIPSSLWDGKPHVIRYEMRTDPVGNDGIYRAWVDGVLIVDRRGFRTSSLHTEIAYFSPGLNMNEGPGISGMQMWWHRIAIYGGNPGW